MKPIFKSSVSLGLLLLVIYIQVALPVLQKIENKSGLNSSFDTSYLIIELDGLHNFDYTVSDQLDIYSPRVEGSATLFYTSSVFSLELFHTLFFGIKWNLSHWVNINFTITDIIFPFAYFW